MGLLGMFMIGFICGFGSAVVWALTNPKEIEKSDNDKEDPFRTW